MGDAVLYLTLALVAVAGTAVAVTRDPVRQGLVSAVFGAMLAVTFLLLAAPGVAMAVVVVDAVAIPVLFLATIANVRGGER